MPSDRDELLRRLEARADGDFAAMTDAELRAYVDDLGRELQAISRPATEHNPHDPEDRARANTGGDMFMRLVEAMREHVLRLLKTPEGRDQLAAQADKVFETDA